MLFRSYFSKLSSNLQLTHPVSRLFVTSRFLAPGNIFIMSVSHLWLCLEYVLHFFDIILSMGFGWCDGGGRNGWRHYANPF